MKKHILKKCKLLGLLLAMVFVAMGIFHGDAVYATDQATMMKKWTFTNLWNCMNGTTYVNSPINIAEKSGNVADSIFKTRVDKMLPSLGFQGASTSLITCKDVFVGGGGVTGALGYYNSSLTSVTYASPGNAKSLLELMGYEGNDDGESSFTIRASYVDHVSNYYIGCNWFGSSCEYDVQGEVQSVKITVKPNSDGGKTYSFEDGFSNFFNTIKIDFENHNMVISVEGNLLAGCFAPSGQSHSFPLKANVQEFANDVDSYFSNTTWTKTCTTASEYSSRTDSYKYNFSTGDIVNLSDQNSFTYNSVHRTRVLSTLSGGWGKTDLKFTDAELYTLYYYYLDKSLPTGVQNRMTCDATNTTNLTEVKLMDTDGAYKTCYVNFNVNGGGTAPENITVNIPQYADGTGPYIIQSNMQVVIDWLNSKSSIDGDVPTIAESSDYSGELAGTTTENEDPCYNQGVEGMSWILCPAINNMANAVGNAQEAVLQWMLAIDTDLYDSKKDNNSCKKDTNQYDSEDNEANEDCESATWKAWDMLRTVANTVLIVMLIAVIFSQLTGYGIDNYGIKKMLPRLVLMAILLNLSFVICQLAVDMSNIVGAGLDNLFQSIGANIYGGASVGETMTDLVALLFGAVGATGAVAGTVISIAAIASGSGVMLAVILVLTLVVALAAIILFFVMIGMRQVAVVASITLAPLAFACYILPNTQSLFKKWWSIFKAMLIVYPLCGAVHGLSYIIRGIVFGGGNTPFFMAIVAVAAPFLPFFMLPSLLKSTMAALGRMGGALLAVGSAWQNGIRSGRNAVQNSEAYKSAMERGHRNMNLGRAGFQYDRKTGQIKTDANRNPLERKMGRFGRFVAGGDVGMARAMAQALRDIDTQNRENELMGSGFSSALAGIREKADAQKVSEYEALLGRGDATVTEDVTDSAGNVTQRTMRVNTGSAESMAAYHMKVLEEYAAATRANDQDAMREAMSKVKAAQNVMAKTDKGRTALQKNFEKRLRNGSSANDMLGLSDAASHIMANYGDKFKAVNREAHAMFQDLSTMDLAGETGGTSNVDVIKGRLSGVNASGEVVTAGEYARRGVSKYTAESLANADDEAIERFVKTASSMRGVTDDKGNDIGEMLKATAYEALQKQQNGTLNIKPEVASQLRAVAKGYIPTPKAGSNELYVRHEEDAMRMGKSTISVTDATGTTTSFEGYAVPTGFNNGIAVNPVKDSVTGHYIYKDASDSSGKRGWDATVGRYVDITGLGI